VKESSLLLLVDITFLLKVTKLFVSQGVLMDDILQDCGRGRAWGLVRAAGEAYYTPSVLGDFYGTG
jgi:hypothetical protein